MVATNWGEAPCASKWRFHEEEKNCKTVGSLYLFSVPRGYTDGFYQWCKQVAAICLTAFLQTTLLFLGMMTFQDNMLLGIGIMLAAGEVPRVAQQFGLDSSVKVNMSSVIYSTNSAVNLARNIMKPAAA